MSEPTPEARIWNLLRGALASRAVAIVADLGVADALAAGPRPVAELARETGADADILHRLLRALASDGIFAETEPRVFRNTEASEVLRRGNGWNDFAHLFGGVWHRTAGDLAATTGEPPFRSLFGTDFWDWLAQHPEERAAFDRAMEQGWEGRVERIAAVDWRGDETVVDVGGGNGSFLIHLLSRHPGLRGIVFDLPETNRDEPALARAGIEFVTGDFFERLPHGDVYVLATILHDWDDERAAAILRSIRASAPPHARLVVVETVVEPGNEPHGAKWLDLLMLALFHGRERDEAQWRALLAAGGFEPVSIADGLIEARCRSR
jgi:O-methyltransferase domain/Dimerisation domain